MIKTRDLLIPYINFFLIKWNQTVKFPHLTYELFACISYKAE